MCTKVLRNSGAYNLVSKYFLNTETHSLYYNNNNKRCSNWKQQQQSQLYTKATQATQTPQIKKSNQIAYIQTELQHEISKSSASPTSNKLLSCCCRVPGSADGIFVKQLHDWKRQMDVNEARRKIIPKLVYLHNPWKFLVTKLNLWKLKWFWDYEFKESEFIEGSKQAAVVMTDIIRKQMTDRISEFTTPVGFQQITRDMLLSRNDSRLKLVRFDVEHLRRAIPMKVATRHNFGRKYAFIDMLFVGLRNTKDFDSTVEVVEVNELIKRMDDELKTPASVLAVPHRIVFAEIFVRFRRDYTEESKRNGAAATQSSNSAQQQQQQLQQMGHINPLLAFAHQDDNSWAVSFYKILTFDVLNYDPSPSKNDSK